MIQSVERAFALMEALDRQARKGFALGDLATQTGLKPPTAHNLLQTLVELGYVTHDAVTRQYAIGEKAWRLGRQQFLAQAIEEIALPVLRKLQSQFDETVLLALYQNGQRHTVASVESRHSLRVGGGTGVDTHLYSTATGRVLLGQLSQRELNRFISSQGLPDTTWPEATTKDALCRELLTIRDERFVSYEVPDRHIQATAVPVELSEPDTFVALGMYYPTVRPPHGGLHRLRKLLREAADAIAAKYESQEYVFGN